jgi:aryl-alcohol dehydrogenase-like predicted oxidoreductase
MKYRRLGKSGPQVSAVGHGRGTQPVRFGEPLEADFNATIRRALDLGINFFDSSNAYWGTRHEVLLGKALKGRRNEATITSKFGNIDLPDGGKATNGRPEHVVESCDASLKRLGGDVIDIYFLHRVDPEVPIEETVGAMAQLISKGKVRFIGICEACVRTLKRAHREHPITALQTEYSLWSRDPEDEILPTVRELGIGFVPYSPLGRGFLTGRIKSVNDLEKDDWRRTAPRFQGENFEKNLRLVDEINAVARDKRCTPSQLALAWVLAQGDDIVPIPGTKHSKYLEENVGALKVTLTDDDLDRIDHVIPIGAAAGERYVPQGMRTVNR